MTYWIIIEKEKNAHGIATYECYPLATGIKDDALQGYRTAFSLYGHKAHLVNDVPVRIEVKVSME
jgi:hypothetical protein